nr:fgf-1 [Darna trima granulovirus]
MLFFVLTTYFLIGTVQLLGTLHLASRPELAFCVNDQKVIFVYDKSSTACSVAWFNVHKHNNNLVLNFKYNNECQYMCLDRCGSLYYSPIFYSEDCTLTTSAFENIETLSVYRYNYSDFIAFENYNSMHFSMTTGANIERFHYNIGLKYNKTSNNVTCKLSVPVNNNNVTRTCVDYKKRLEHTEYVSRKHYHDYSFWTMLLIKIGLKSYIVPTANFTMSVLEYN